MKTQFNEKISEKLVEWLKKHKKEIEKLVEESKGKEDLSKLEATALHLYKKICQEVFGIDPDTASPTTHWIIVNGISLVMGLLPLQKSIGDTSPSSLVARIARTPFIVCATLIQRTVWSYYKLYKSKPTKFAISASLSIAVAALLYMTGKGRVSEAIIGAIVGALMGLGVAKLYEKLEDSLREGSLKKLRKVNAALSAILAAVVSLQDINDLYDI